MIETPEQIDLPRQYSIGKRYKDAYQIAEATVTLGGTIKGVAMVAGIGAVVIGLLVNWGKAEVSWEVSWLVWIAGALIMIIGFLAGVIISASGQIMRAQLDTAVNTSLHADLDEKAEIMGLTADGH